MLRLRAALVATAFAVASVAPAHAIYLDGPSVLKTGDAAASVQKVHRRWRHGHHTARHTYFGFGFGAPFGSYPYYGYAYPYGPQTYYRPYVYQSPYAYRPYSYAYPSDGMYPCPPGDPWRNGCIGR